jgi:GPH family glycoside/pentoside/hexuronide:cation symporter
VLMLGTSAIYFAKSGITTGWVILWLLVLYAGYSMLVLSQAAWAAALVREYHGRARVYGLIQAVGVMGSLTVLILPQLLAKLAPHLPLRGVPLMGAILMVAAPVTALITVSFAHEPARVEARRSSGSLGDYWELLRRGSTIRVLGADFFCNMGPAITAPLYLFFFEEARGYSLSEANILLVVYISGTLLGPAFWARLTHRFGKHTTLRLATLVYAVLQTGLLMLPGHVPAAMTVAMFCVGFTASAFVFLTRAMLADVSDEVRLETGQDRTALLYALVTTTSKMGSTLSVGIAYALLPLFGFRAVAGAVNDAHAIFGLEACYLVPPIASVLLGGLFMWGYRLDAARHAEIRRALG